MKIRVSIKFDSLAEKRVGNAGERIVYYSSAIRYERTALQ